MHDARMQKPVVPQVRITNRDDADKLIGGVLTVMGDLEAVLEAETAHVRVGRLREGLSQEAKKSELTASYIQGLEAVKANAIALARLAPEGLDRLKAAHARFGQVVETNQVVLATARAVSESLVKGIAEEMNRHSRAQSYAPPGPIPVGRPRSSEPLVVSKSL